MSSVDIFVYLSRTLHNTVVRNWCLYLTFTFRRGRIGRLLGSSGDGRRIGARPQGDRPDGGMGAGRNAGADLQLSPPLHSLSSIYK